MKIAVLLTAVALASGSALAASNSSNSDSRDTAKTHKAPVVVKDRAADAQDTKPGIVDKTKSAIRRMGEKLGHATERLPGNKSSSQAANDPSRTEATRSSDTRSMGAASSDDSARQRRMDDAYNNWRARQK